MGVSYGMRKADVNTPNVNNTPRTFGYPFSMPIDWIWKRLEDIGKSQADMARAIGRAEPRVSELKNKGQPELRADEVAPLADCLEMDPGEVARRLAKPREVIADANISAEERQLKRQATKIQAKLDALAQRAKITPERKAREPPKRRRRGAG